MDELFPNRLTGERHFKHAPIALLVEIARVDNRDVSPHMHTFVEMVYVSRGSGMHSIYDVGAEEPRSYPIESGDVFLITPDLPHAYHDNNGLEVYNIIFKPEVFGDEAASLCALPGLIDFLLLEPLFREEDAFAHKLHLKQTQARQIQSYLDTIISEQRDQPQGHVLRMRAQFIEMLVMLARCFSARQEDADDRVTGGRHRAVEQALAFMQSHFNQELSLQDIALSAYLSPNYFSETFKAQVGVPPWEYLTGLRLEQATQLLRDSDRSITDIAFSVGFGDSSYFSRVFKERYQQTPSQYRKALQSR